MKKYWSNKEARDANREKLKSYWATGGHFSQAHKLTKEQRLDVARRFLAGEKKAHMALLFGVSHRTITNAVQENCASATYKSRLPVDVIAQARRLRSIEGYSWAQLGATLGFNPSTIRRALLAEAT